MTEQEREAFSVRLERVWGCINPVWSEMSTRGILTFFGQTKDSQLEYDVRPSSGEIVVHLTDYQLGASLRYFNYGEFGEFDNPQVLQNWTEAHFLFFRRGCWLSGCPIEASAHEKAKWIQGFSREELEAWNLKM